VTDFVLVSGQALAIRRRSHAGYAERAHQWRHGRRPVFRCVLTQTTRDSVIAKHIRSEPRGGRLPGLDSEMTNRVVYAEAALWGATPSFWTKRARPHARSRQSPTRLHISARARLTSYGQQAHEQEEISQGCSANVRTRCARPAPRRVRITGQCH
jgi:hypothetical protein